MSFVRNATGLLLTSAFTVPVGLLTGIVLARALSADDRGLYAVAITLAGVGGLAGKLGLPSATIHRVRRVGRPPATVAATGLAIALAASLVLGLLGVALSPVIRARFLADAPAVTWTLALGLVATDLLTSHFASLARATDRFRFQNAAQASTSVLTLLALFCVLVLGDGALVAALAGVLTVQVCVTTALGVAVLRHTGLALPVSPAEIPPTLRFGLKSYAQDLAGQLHERVDVFMLAWLIGDPALVALYAVGAGAAGRLKMIPMALGAAAFPELAGLPRAEAAAFTARLARQALLAVAACAIPLALAAPLLLPLLYGETYRPAVLPFVTLLPAMALFTVYRVVSRFFTAIDRQQANVVTQVLAVALNVGLNLWWIPRFGVIGAAGASLASYVLEAILISAMFVRATGLPVSAVLRPQRSDVAQLWARARTLARRVGPGAR